VEGTMKYFNKIYRFLWIGLIFLIMVLFYQDRTLENEGRKEIISAFESSPYLSILTISFLILLTVISVLRTLEARNQWRKIGNEDEVDKVLDRIEKDKEIN